MAAIHYRNLDISAPEGFEYVKCAICKLQVLVDKRIDKKTVITKKDIFLCPRCLVASDPLRFRDAEKQDRRDSGR